MPSLNFPPILLRRRIGGISYLQKALPEEQPKKFGCVMACVPLDLRKEITDWTLENIPDFYLAKDGIEAHPHVTILFGLEQVGGEITQQLQQILGNFGPFEVTLSKLSLFTGGKDGDVLKVDIDSPHIHQLHELLAVTIPHEETFKDYLPHLTLAYLDPTLGISEKCTQLNASFLGKTFRVTEVEFSDKNKNKVIIPMVKGQEVGQKGIKAIPATNIPASSTPKAPSTSPHPDNEQGYTGEIEDKRGHTICYRDGKRVTCGNNEPESETEKEVKKEEGESAPGHGEGGEKEPLPENPQDKLPDDPFDKEWDKIVGEHIDEIEKNDAREHEFTPQEVAREQNWHKQIFDYMKSGGKVTPPIVSRFISGLANSAIGTLEYISEILDENGELIAKTPKEIHGELKSKLDEINPNGPANGLLASVIGGLFGQEGVAVTNRLNKDKANESKANKEKDREAAKARKAEEKETKRQEKNKPKEVKKFMGGLSEDEQESLKQEYQEAVNNGTHTGSFDDFVANQLKQADSQIDPAKAPALVQKKIAEDPKYAAEWKDKQRRIAVSKNRGQKKGQRQAAMTPEQKAEAQAKSEAKQAEKEKDISKSAAFWKKGIRNGTLKAEDAPDNVKEKWEQEAAEKQAKKEAKKAGNRPVPPSIPQTKLGQKLGNSAQNPQSMNQPTPTQPNSKSGGVGPAGTGGIKNPPPNQKEKLSEARKIAEEADLNDVNREGAGVNIKDRGVPDEVGQQFDAHGLNSLNDLSNLLNNGIDKDRSFFTTPLAGKHEHGVDSLRDTGNFVLIGHPGQGIKDGGIGGVLVSGHYSDPKALQSLKDAFPGVDFIPADKAKEELGKRAKQGGDKVEYNGGQQKETGPTPPKVEKKKNTEWSKFSGGGMGQAIGENYREALKESVEKTGKLRPEEKGSLLDQVYERAVAAGYPRNSETLQRAYEVEKLGHKEAASKFSETFPNKTESKKEEVKDKVSDHKQEKQQKRAAEKVKLQQRRKELREKFKGEKGQKSLFRYEIKEKIGPDLKGKEMKNKRKLPTPPKVSTKSFGNYGIKKWVTIEHTHVLLDGSGDIVKGPNKLVGKKPSDLPQRNKPEAPKIQTPKAKKEEVKNKVAEKLEEHKPQKDGIRELGVKLEKQDKPIEEKKIETPKNIQLTKDKKYKEKVAQDTLGFKPTPENLASAMGLPDGSSITVKAEELPSGYRYKSNVECEARGEGFGVTRRFTIDKNGKKVCRNVLITSEGGGLGTKIFTAQVRDLASKGFDAITCHAEGHYQEGDGGFVGYKVWPKFGYDGELDEKHKEGLKQAGEQFSKVETLQELYAMPGGKEAWEKYGSGIELSFDLKPGSKSMKILDAYLAAKKTKGGQKSYFRNYKIKSMENQEDIEGVEEPDLSPEDEKALEEAWKKLGNENGESDRPTSLKEKYGEKHLSFYNIKGGFTGQKEDKLGRTFCYQDGHRVPCNKPKAPKLTKPADRAEEPKKEEPKKESVTEITEKRAKEDFNNLKDQYLKKGGGVFDDKGNLKSVVLNTDDWRELFPEYVGTNAFEVHKASSYCNKKLFAEVLQTMKGKGNNSVIILAGGGGSGKSGVNKFVTASNYPIQLDQVSDEVEGLIDKIKVARENGFDVDYVFVDRKPEDAWSGGVVPRAVNARKKGQLARTVPLEIALKANIHARKTAIEILKNNLDIPVKILDNTNGFENSRLITDREEAIKHLEKESYDYEKLYGKLKEETRSKYEKGEIDEDIAEGLIGKENIRKQKNLRGMKNGSGTVLGRSNISSNDASRTETKGTTSARFDAVGRSKGISGGRKTFESETEGSGSGTQGKDEVQRKSDQASFTDRPANLKKKYPRL